MTRNPDTAVAVIELIDSKGREVIDLIRGKRRYAAQVALVDGLGWPFVVVVETGKFARFIPCRAEGLRDALVCAWRTADDTLRLGGTSVWIWACCEEIEAAYKSIPQAMSEDALLRASVGATN